MTSVFGNCVPSLIVNDFLLKLNITLYHMIGHDVEDPYVVIKDGGYYEPSKEAVDDRWVFAFGVTRQNGTSFPRVASSFGVVFGCAEVKEEGEDGVVGMELSLLCHLQKGDRKGFV